PTQISVFQIRILLNQTPNPNMEHPAVKRRTSSQLFNSADLTFSTILGEEREVEAAKPGANPAPTNSTSINNNSNNNSNNTAPSISAINAIANRLSHKRMRRRSSFGLVRGIESDPPVFTPGIWVDKISSSTIKSPSPALSPLMNHVPTSVASSPVLARVSSPHLPPTVSSQGHASYGSLDLQVQSSSVGSFNGSGGGGGGVNFRPPTFQTQQPQQLQIQQQQQTLHLQPTIRSSSSGANSPMMASPIISSTSSSTVTQSTVNTLAMMQQQQRLLIQQQNMNKSGSNNHSKSANPSPRMSHTNLPPQQNNQQQKINNSPMQKNLAPPMVIQSNGSPMLHPMNLPSQANMRPQQQQQQQQQQAFSNQQPHPDQQSHLNQQQPNNGHHPVTNHYHHQGASLLQQQIMSKAYVSPSPVFQAMSMTQPNWALKQTDAFNSGISMNDVSPQIQQLPTPKKSHATNPTVGKLKAKGSSTTFSVSQSTMSSPTPELERVLEERDDDEEQESLIDVETESQPSLTAPSPRSIHQGIKRPASTALPFNALHSKAFKRGANSNAATPQAPPPSTKLSTVTSASATPSPSKPTPKRLPKQKQQHAHNYSLETKLFQFSLLPPQTRVQIFSYLSPVALAKFRAIDRLAGASVLWNPLLRAKDAQLHRNLTITHSTNLHHLVDVLRGRQSPSAAAENVVLFWNGIVDVFMKRQKGGAASASALSRYSTEWIAFAIVETGKRVMNGMRCSACHMRPRVKDAVWCSGCGAFACGPKNFGKKCTYKG
ncbi:hypothetical protein HDU80_001902, partial [Chytriomyces hyalinus]